MLNDNMFAFWYRFIPKAYSVIEMGQGDQYFDLTVKPALHSYMGNVFEEMCRHYTFEQGMSGRFGSMLTMVGSWWGMENAKEPDDAVKRIPADIDVVGISDIDNSAVIGECKYRTETMAST